jgi:hypothetical protein
MVTNAPPTPYRSDIAGKGIFLKRALTFDLNHYETQIVLGEVYDGKYVHRGKLCQLFLR